MRQKSLLSRILFLFILSISIPFLLISIVFSNIYNHQLKQNNITNITNTLTSITTSMKLYIDELNSIANIPYYTNTVFQTMAEINENKDMSAMSTRDKPAGREYRVAFFKYMYDSLQVIDSVIFYPENNPTLSAYQLSRNVSHTEVFPNSAYKQEEWYETLLEDSTTSAFFPEYDDEGNLSLFSYVKTIQDVDTKKRIGFIKVSASANSYMRLINNITMGPDSSLCIVYGSDTILYHHTVEPNTKKYHSLNILRDEMKGHYQELSSQVEDTNLQLTYLLSNNDLLLNQLRTYGVTLLIIMMSTSISFLLYQYQAKKIIITISNIKNALNHVAEGDFKPILLQPKETELNEIIASVNHMIKELNEYIEKEYKANIMQQEAEYLALQAQINPHFLYNTLNSFIGLNRMNKRSLLETSILNLTRLFQYTCKAGTVVTINEEIQFVEEYLALQSIKFDERLSYTIDMDASIGNQSIPKLLLQPLIENSIIHGLEPTDRPIHITLRGTLITYLENDYVYLTVIDNGIGFSLLLIIPK